jgi:hypothetical protein
MKRVVVLPLSEAARFPDLEVIALDRNLAAFVGSTAPGRTREAYDTDESFLEAVAHGYADRYTFDTVDEAAAFAKRKLEDLARTAQNIEDALLTRRTEKPQPKTDRGDLLQVIQRKKKPRGRIAIRRPKAG